MKLIRILFAVFCLILFNGCSTVDSYQILCLTNKIDEFREVKRDDWKTRPQDPYFGEWMPPLYEFSFGPEDDLVVYPIVVSVKNWCGPVLLPVIPSPKVLCHPDYENLLRFVYSGDPEDILIEIVNEKPVDPKVVKKAKTSGGTMISIQLDESFVADGKLKVKLSCRGAQKTLEYVSEQFTSFRPLLIPSL